MPGAAGMHARSFNHGQLHADAARRRSEWLPVALLPSAEAAECPVLARAAAATDCHSVAGASLRLLVCVPHSFTRVSL